MKKALKLLSNNSAYNNVFSQTMLKKYDSHFVNQTINMRIHMTSLFNAQS